MSDDVQLEEECKGIVVIDDVEPTRVVAMPKDETRVQIPLRIVSLQVRVRRSRQGGEGFADATASADAMPFGFWSVMVPVKLKDVQDGDAISLTAVVRHLQAMLADGIDVMTLTERSRPQGRTVDESVRSKAGTVP